MVKQKTDRYTRDLFTSELPKRQVKAELLDVRKRAAAFRARSKFNMLKRSAGDGGC